MLPIAPLEERSVTLRQFTASLALLLSLPLARAFAADDPVALMDDGHYRRARVLVDARAAAHPEDPGTVFLLARLELAAGDAAAALPLAEKAATLAPRNAAHRYLVAQCVGSMAQRAGALKGLGLAKRFKREAEAALVLDPRHVDAHEGLIEFYSVAPGIAGGSDKRAHALAGALVGIDPARGRLAEATLLFRDKKDAPGEEALRQALAADPNSYRVRMTMVRFFANDTRKKWGEAEEHAKAALAINPGRSAAYGALAGLYAHLERWNDLDRILAEGERAVPDNLSPYYQAARTLLGDDREHARAERFLRRFLTQEPEVGGPTLAHAHWRLGLAIEKQGRKPEALAEVQTALQLKPDLDEAKKDLKRLKKG
jgi:tetratricopeptide (TPR) repeat protein